jgi:hypothetical protein
MASNQKHDGKDEKDDEKHDDKHKGDGKEKGKWQKDPLSGVLFGLALIVVSAIYLGRSYLPSPDLWWAWALTCIGVLFIIKAVAHMVKPEWRRPISGDIILGIILIAIGMRFIYGIEDWLPYLLIVAGALLLIHYIRRAY